MVKLTEFQRTQIVGARIVCTSETKVAEVFEASRGIESEIMTKQIGTGKIDQHKDQRRRICVLNDRGKRMLRMVFMLNQRSNAPMIAAEINT